MRATTSASTPLTGGILPTPTSSKACNPESPDRPWSRVTPSALAGFHRHRLPYPSVNPAMSAGMREDSSMTIKSLIPAERWEDMTAIYSAHRATEQKGADPVSVSAAVYGSYLYTAFGVIHRPWGYLNQPTIMAWRLVPLDLYKGETTTLYHDAQAIKQGLRERGDHTGLVVRHKGDLLVCTTPVELRCDLPVKHLSLDEAKAHDQHERGYAWRSILF